jgi:hypothetical protein
MHRTNLTNLHLPGDPSLGVTVNLPPAVKGRGLNGLPPYARIKGHAVEDYPACPASWPKGPSSYFVPIEEGMGMWLDLNVLSKHPHDVAAVLSIQGINPLTGRKAAKLDLERYPDDPSVEAWLRGYQNYLSTVVTPMGQLWIDGFRGTDGTVRQYVFTKDESRGVAAQLIGVDRVFAIGIALFLSKAPKPKREVVHVPGLAVPYQYQQQLWWNENTLGHYFAPQNTDYFQGPVGSSDDSYKFGGKLGGPTTYSSSQGETILMANCANINPEAIEVTKVELAAGEKIEQQLYRDHTERSYWADAPAGVITINYAPAEEVERILQSGRARAKEGFLDQLKVGA